MAVSPIKCSYVSCKYGYVPGRPPLYYDMSSYKGDYPGLLWLWASY